MATKYYRLPGLIPTDIGGNETAGLAPPIFAAADNGDGTHTQVVGTVSEPAPVNFAQESGGNLAAILAKLLGTLTVGLPTNAAKETGGNLAALLGSLTTLTGQLGPTIVKAVSALAVTANTPQTIWTPASGKQIQLMGFALSGVLATAAILKYGAGSTELLRTPTLLAATPYSSPQFGAGIAVGSADDVLKFDVSASTTLNGFVFGREV